MTEETEVNPELEDEVQNFGRTGFFRDGIRRIDMVLVVEDDGNPKTEQIKINFLTNAVKFGLILELEPGLMVFHKRLIFVKVHAPESIVEEYGRKFEVCRYFKQNHVEFVNPKGIVQRLLRYIGYAGSYEKEWIKLVRKKYPNPKRFSTLERSIIVYKLLLMLPFGDYENYVGFNRLLQRGIVLDAFPLHDGPYFAVPKQFPAEYNARQILNYNWVGLGNILKFQPLNLIHEYFGDRMAFFFAFYGFYTFSLIFPAVISTMAIVPEILNKTDDRAYDVEDFHPRPVKTICPRCRYFETVETCRFLPFFYYERAIWYNNMFDRENIDAIIVYIVIWATFFVLFWRRKEYYWMWMWECKPEILANTVRAEYVPNKKELPGKDNGKLYPILKSVTTLVIGLLTMGCYLFLWAGLAVCLLFLQDFIIVKFAPKFELGLGHYKVLTIFYLTNVFIILFFEKVWSFLSYTLNNLQNHRTENDYESSLVLKLFGFTFPFDCTLFLYIAFVKNRIFTHPQDPTMYKYPFVMTQCNPVGCNDELALSLFVTIIMKECLFNLMSHIQALFFMRTDYNQGKSLNINVPCWEREYRLTPVKEDFVTDKFKSLAIQFGLSVGFLCGCPLTLFFIICINVLDIRITAWRLVKGCRRPLLQNNRGLGSWKNVFIILIFATLIINFLIVTITTSRFRFSYHYARYTRRRPKYNAHLRGMYPKDILGKIENLYVEKVQRFFNFTECHYEAALYGTERSDYSDGAIPQRILTWYYLIWYRLKYGAHYFTTGVSWTALAIVFLFTVIPPNQSDIEQTKAIEKDIIERK